MPAPAVVQSGANGGTGGNKAVTLAGAPTDGNLLLGFFYDDAGAAPPATINGWTRVAKTSDNRGTIYSRIASGLSATLPTMDNGDTGYTAEIAYEISNADTVDSDALASLASPGTSLSIGPATTVNDTALAILFGVGWFAVSGALPTITAGGWTQDRSVAEGTVVTVTSGHQSIATHGTSYSGTVSWGASSQNHAAGAVAAVYKSAPVVTPQRALLLQGVG